LLAKVVNGLGHEVIAREVRVAEVAAVTARERPDVALVGLGESSEHALQLISEIVRGAFCPVIALLEDYDPEWVNEAAERGVYAYIVDTRPESFSLRSTSRCAATASFRMSKARSRAAGRGLIAKSS